MGRVISLARLQRCEAGDRIRACPQWNRPCFDARGLVPEI